MTSVITGATRPEQVIANAAAAPWTLTPAEAAEVAALAPAEPRGRSGGATPFGGRVRDRSDQGR